MDEEETLSAVMQPIRQLFPIVAEDQARELARSVIRTLARDGIVLAKRKEPGE
jgi:hypothetical protein